LRLRVEKPALELEHSEFALVGKPLFRVAEQKRYRVCEFVGVRIHLSHSQFCRVTYSFDSATTIDSANKMHRALRPAKATQND
jgi:hypothetical protein